MFTYASTTDLGSREINEDSFIAVDNSDSGCFVVADGLGGHDKGEVASRIAAETFFDAFDDYKSGDDMVEFMDKTFTNAQNAIMHEQEVQHAPDKMKTTCVALLIDSDKAIWGHVGDTRLYVFNKNKVKLRTIDHSVPQMLVMAGEIKEKNIRNHPDRNRLLRVMGIPWDSKRQEVSEVSDLKDAQAFLLCTDGFWELVNEKMMCKFLKKSKSVGEWLTMMKAEVEKNGQGKDMDNNTAVAVWVS